MDYRAVGAGKTVFAGGFIRGCLVAQGIQSAASLIVTSPTFSLLASYRAPGAVSVHHVDAFRLKDETDAMALDLPCLFRTSVMIMEWPDRVRRICPTSFISVMIEYVDIDSEVEQGDVAAEPKIQEGCNAQWIDEDAVILSRRITITAKGFENSGRHFKLLSLLQQELDGAF